MVNSCFKKCKRSKLTYFVCLVRTNYCNLVLTKLFDRSFFFCFMENYTTKKEMFFLSFLWPLKLIAIIIHVQYMYSVIEIVTFVREAIVAVKNGRRSTLGQILILSTTELNSWLKLITSTSARVYAQLVLLLR